MTPRGIYASHLAWLLPSPAAGIPAPDAGFAAVSTARYSHPEAHQLSRGRRMLTKKPRNPPAASDPNAKSILSHEIPARPSRGLDRPVSPDGWLRGSA